MKVFRSIVFGFHIATQVVDYAATKGPVAVAKFNLNGVLPPAPGGISAWNDLYMFPGLHFAQNVWRAYDDNPLTSGDCVGDPMRGVDRMNGGNPSCSNDAATVFKAAVDLAVGYKCTNVEAFSDDLKNLLDAIATRTTRSWDASQKELAHEDTQAYPPASQSNTSLA